MKSKVLELEYRAILLWHFSGQKLLVVIVAVPFFAEKFHHQSSRMNLSKQERKEKNRTIQAQAGLLPGAFNVTEAIAARQFEIKAMEQAIANGS